MQIIYTQRYSIGYICLSVTRSCCIFRAEYIHINDISMNIKTVFPVTLIMKKLNGYSITREPFSYLHKIFWMWFGSAPRTRPQHLCLE